MQTRSVLERLPSLVLCCLLGAVPVRAMADPPSGSGDATASEAAPAPPSSKKRARRATGRSRTATDAKARRHKPTAAKHAEETAAGDRDKDNPNGASVNGDERGEMETVAGALATQGEGDPAETESGMRHSRHMEFDARLVRGETAGSGAVVLFDRGERQLPRLTRLRESFLRATIEPVLGKFRGREPDSAPSSSGKAPATKREAQPATGNGRGE